MYTQLYSYIISKRSSENVDSDLIPSLKFRLNSLMKYTIYKDDLISILEMKKALSDTDSSFINFVDLQNKVEKLESKQPDIVSFKYRVNVVCQRMDNALETMKKLTAMSQSAAQVLKEGIDALAKLQILAANIPDFNNMHPLDLDGYSTIILSAEQWLNDFERFIRKSKQTCKVNLIQQEQETVM